MFVVAFLAGVGVGLTLAVLGAGGSIFIVPVLVYALHETASQATGTSLGIVFSGALVGAITHWRKGNLVPRVMALFGSTATIGAFGGAWLHPLVSEQILLGLFATILFVAAARMALGPPQEASSGEPPHPVLLLCLGVAIGVLSGFLGVGGGFLIVPALTWGARLPLREAIGTSLAVIAMTSLSGTIGHALQGHVQAGVLALVGCGAIAGALLGTPLSGKLPERPLRLTFAVVIFGIAVFMTVKLGIHASEVSPTREGVESMWRRRAPGHVEARRSLQAGSFTEVSFR